MFEQIRGRFRPKIRAEGSPLERRIRVLSARERREEAQAFISAFYKACGASGADYRRRWREVLKSLIKTGTYEHTSEELAYGARVAWRNNARCIGRLFWESLEVIDCRTVQEPGAVADQVFKHLGASFNGGQIRSMISVFEPIRPGERPCWIESAQVLQYACHSLPGGKIIGDRQNSEATRIALSLGWEPPQPPGPFDILPLIVRDRDDRRHIYDIPPEVIHEVPIAHSAHPGLEVLGLRWYSTPVVSNMVLTIGGIDYPCAPFNGFYMGTEIGSRDFADIRRYDLLEDIARAVGINTGPAKNKFWQDHVLTIINEAVIESFSREGVSILDHHSASEQFMKFHRREQASGRRVCAEWSWIVPPQASAACEVFHLPMEDFHPVPNYYHDRGTDGLRLMPWYGDARRNLMQRSKDRLRRTFKYWKRIAW